MSLSKFVYTAVQNTVSGLKHRDIVKSVLENGYVHQGDIPISQAVHDSLLELVRCGAISRIETDSMRTYQGKQYITCKTARDLREKVLAEDFSIDVMDYACPSNCRFQEQPAA